MDRKCYKLNEVIGLLTPDADESYLRTLNKRLRDSGELAGCLHLGSAIGVTGNSSRAFYIQHISDFHKWVENSYGADAMQSISPCSFVKVHRLRRLR